MDAVTTGIGSSAPRGGPAPDIVGALAGAAAALGAATAPDELLGLLAMQACRVLSISRCAIYLRDGEVGPFRGTVAYPPRRRDADEWMQRSIAGIAADRFTQEILATRRPVLITDARQDPRCVRRAMMRWDIHAMLGTPMLLGDQVAGLMFVDNGDAPYDYSPQMQHITCALAEIGTVALDRVRQLARLRKTAATVGRQNQLLRRAAMADDEFRAQLLGGARIEDLASSLAEMTGKPCGIYDRDLRTLAFAAPNGPVPSAPAASDLGLGSMPQIVAALTGLSDREPTVVGPAPEHGVHRRLLATRAGTDFVVVMERARELSPFDTIAARRAASAVAVLLRSQRRTAAAELHSRQALLRELLHGQDCDASLRRHAQFHGLDLEAPRVVCLLSPGLEGPPVTAAGVDHAWRLLGRRDSPLCADVPGGVTLLLDIGTAPPVGAGVARASATARELAGIVSPGSALSIAISSPCRRSDDYPLAARECDALVQRSRFTSLPESTSAQPAAAEDLGAGRLLLSPGIIPAAERFALDVLAPLLEHGDDIPALLETLICFLDANRNVRETGRRLGIHENTVRHRLRRAGRLMGFGLQAEPQGILSAELAVLILRQLGRLPEAVSTDAGPADARAPR